MKLTPKSMSTRRLPLCVYEHDPQSPHIRIDSFLCVDILPDAAPLSSSNDVRTKDIPTLYIYSQQCLAANHWLH